MIGQKAAIFSSPLTGNGATDAAQDRLLRSKGDSPEKIRAAAAQFEAVFVTQLFQAMRKTVPQDGMMSGGFGGKAYMEMLDSEYAKQLSMGGGLGLGKMLARELGGEAAANATPEKEGASSTAMTQSAFSGRGIQGLDRVATIDRLLKESAGKNLCSAAPADMQEGFAWPAPGRITSKFGARRDPLNGNDSFHSGIDLATPAGTPVRALAAGVVVEAGKKGGYGNVVVVEHEGGFRSLYAHNTEVLHEVGARVNAGDPIAISGATGRVTGPHVHLEVRQGGVPVDPIQFVRGGR